MKNVFYILLILGSCIASAQKATAIDTILDQANFQLYEYPEKTVRIGLGVLDIDNITNEQRIEALLLISTAYSAQRNYGLSMDYAVRAEQLLKTIDDDAFRIITYTRLGVQFQQLKIYNTAHSYLNKAISIATTTNETIDIHKLLGFNYAIRGMVYKEQMSCDIAQNYFNKSLYHYSQSLKKSINDANLSVIVYNKGNCFLSMSKIDSARICFTNSYRYADQIEANSLKAFANKGLAEVNTFEGKYPTAITLLLDAEKMSADVGDLVLNQGIYKGLSDNYMLVNNIPKHEFYERKYDQTTKRIEAGDIETLNKFVVQINAESDKEIEGIKSHSLYYKIPLIAVTCLLAGLLIYQFYRSQKKYKSLKTERDTLKNASL
jgi:tetratricopeptide (TPR) repeat protein